MAVAQRISEQEYRELALNDQDGLWELWDGVPRRKPPMSMLHDDVAAYLGAALIFQLDRDTYRVNVNGGKTRVSERNYYIPDVVVIPTSYKRPYLRDPHAFDAFAEPFPLVVEVWSRTTGEYDLTVKLEGYRARGDAEIWYIHPYERTLTVWRRQPDSSYSTNLYTGGVVPVTSLPGTSIDMDDIFALSDE